VYISSCAHGTDGKIAEHYNKAENASVWADPVMLDATLVLHEQSGHYTFIADSCTSECYYCFYAAENN